MAAAAAAASAAADPKTIDASDILRPRRLLDVRLRGT